jgi:uroporphyrinogen III methyltransferase/synthase
MTNRSQESPGIVYLVGAGPGAPGLITVRGAACMQRADIVLYDYLVDPATLGYASPSAELVCLGRPGAGRDFSPDAIVARMLTEAQKGKIVVRLKGGDPSIFGRGADETEALRKAGIPFEIVPGITAALAAAAFCEIPITHHAGASAIGLITGQERRGKATSSLDYGALAQFPGTLVFYMGVARVAQWSQALITRGKPPETPVAIVTSCGRAQQRLIRCTLGTAAQVVGEQGIRPPALCIVGSVVDHAPPVPWFAARPLFGVRVLVAGSPHVSDKLRDRLSELGADVLTKPAIHLTDPPDWAPVDAALQRLDRYDWLVFSSGTGVDYLLERLYAQGGDVRRLGRVKLAAIGSGTAERLARYHLRADRVPEQFVAESLAQALLGEAERRRFLVARASGGREVLADALTGAGGDVDQIVVYGSVGLKDPDPDVARALSAGEIHWITVTSSSTAAALVRLYGEALRRARFASIGPLSSAALRGLGYEPAAEAAPHTSAGLVEAILRVAAAGGGGRAGCVQRT